MSIEKYNYSTSDKIKNSIQDEIDEKKLEISSITKESLKKLKVDIFDGKSYLRIRDENGKVVGKLKDNDDVDFNGEKKEIGGKLFLGITFNGKKCFISADYVVRHESINPSPAVKPATKAEGDAPAVKPATKAKGDAPAVKPATKAEGDAPAVKPATKAEGETTNDGEYLAGVDIPNEKTKKPEYKQTYLFENGTTYLIGKDGKKINQNNELSPESKKLLKNYEKASILSEILEIWINQAKKTVDGLHWKDSRNDDEIILEKISNIQDKFSYIFQDVQKGKDINVNDVNDVWKLILEAENEESIIGASDMEKVKGFLMNDLDNKDQKLVKIYNQMRYGGLSGNSEMVKEKVANHLLNSEEFKDVNEILKNPKLLEHISSYNKAEVSKILGSTELGNLIVETYIKIESKQKKHIDEYTKQLESINTEREKSGKEKIKLNDFIKLNVDLSIENILTHTLLERKVENGAKRGNEKDSYKGMYANITGLGENKGFINDGVFTISDNNIDTAIDISSTLALSIVSMGVGALAARGALAAATWGARATGVADLVNKSTKFGGLARFGSTAAVEGVAFYEGTTITNNLIYGNTDWNSETGNAKEIFKSIAFMGVLRGATKVMEKAQWSTGLHGGISKTDMVFKGIGKLSEKVPPLMFKNTSITAILAEAGLLTTTSVGLEFAFEGEANWTWEEYLQAIVMVSMMRVASGKITFRKNKEGNTEAEISENPKPKSGTEKLDTKSNGEVIDKLEYFKHKKTGKVYTKDSEGKFYNENGKKVTVKEENLEKTEVPKVNSGTEKVETKSKVEYLKKVSELAALKGKEIYSSIKSKLSSSGKEKLEKTYKESDFIKDFKENLWAKVEKDYEGFRFISGTFKAPIRTVVFGAEQTGKRILSPAWEISSALNPIKMHKNLNWSQKIVGSLTASTIAESISLAMDDKENSIFDAESLINIPVNAAHLATVGFWAVASEPLMNTLYGKFKGFEPRDFLPAYFNNTLFWQPMPYEMGESLLLKDKEVLKKTLKAFLDSGDYKETDYEIVELRKRLKELETK